MGDSASGSKARKFGTGIVFWDIENAGVPQGMSVKEVVKRIRAKVQELVTSIVSIQCYHEVQAFGKAHAARTALLDHGVKVVDVPHNGGVPSLTLTRAHACTQQHTYTSTHLPPSVSPLPSLPVLVPPPWRWRMCVYACMHACVCVCVFCWRGLLCLPTGILLPLHCLPCVYVFVSGV